MAENRQVRCFLSVHSVYGRDYKTLRGFRAEWVVRGAASGHVLYASTVKPTAYEARQLARKYAASRPWLVDATSPEVLAMHAADDAKHEAHGSEKSP